MASTGRLTAAGDAYVSFHTELQMKEKLMQELIIHYPSEVLEEPGLTYLQREVITGNNRLDIVLLDRMDRHVLVEVQSGSLDTKHIDRHIDYSEGYLEKNPTIDIRILYIANHIDIHRKNFLQRRGYEYKEISQEKFKELALAHGYPLGADYELPKNSPTKDKHRIMVSDYGNHEISTRNIDVLVAKLKSSPRYQLFQSILPTKIAYEAKAQRFIQQNANIFTAEHLKYVFELIDPIYPHFSGRWFGRLISINQERIVREGDDKIGRWMSELMRSDISDEDIIDSLRRGGLHLKQASVGIITLILYLKNMSSYSIWFEPLHNGLSILYPELGKFNGRGNQYVIFNKVAKAFSRRYSFKDNELDFVFQEIHKLQ
jgi:hypothetical protein